MENKMDLDLQFLFKRYKAKPAETKEIEAIELTEENIHSIVYNAARYYSCNHEPDDIIKYAEDDGKIIGAEIDTLEGKMTANFGDMIIRGLHGEFYPCKKEIFDKKYEEV